MLCEIRKLYYMSELKYKLCFLIKWDQFYSFPSKKFSLQNGSYEELAEI